MITTMMMAIVIVMDWVATASWTNGPTGERNVHLPIDDMCGMNSAKKSSDAILNHHG